ncbi:MAG: hypothetical protein DMG13_17975 [Acidobacteria bacterium]|nr:MAG: hypothetical protein DMG13_17975 [Acidobacteriota bacterium]
MARGWESKAVEDQINAREDPSNTNLKTTLTPVERQLRAKRESLLLARTRTVKAMETARDERYRFQLEQALAHLDDQLGQIGQS